MIESKHLPREMVLKRACTPEEKIKNGRERQRLLNDINDIKISMQRIRKNRASHLQSARNLQQQLDQLVADSVFNKKLEFALDGLGTLVSRGKVNSAGRKIGNALGILAAAVGLTTIEQQIKRTLFRLEGHMLNFEELGKQLTHLEDGMRGMHQARNKLTC